MRKILYIFAVISFSAVSSTSYGQVDSCIYIQPDSIAPYWVNTNIDSVGEDTCASSPTYRYYYSKRYDVFFKVNAFHLGYGTPDSIMIVHWEDIDTTYSLLRDSFASIYTTWGAYHFRKMRPEDTSHSYDAYKMIFDEYQQASLGVLDALDSIWTQTGQIEAGLNKPLNPPNSVGEKHINKSKYSLDIIPNPTNNYFTLIPSDNNISGIVNVRIFDQRGVVVASESVDISSENKVNVSSLASGVYQVYCDDAKVGSLVIQK